MPSLASLLVMVLRAVVGYCLSETYYTALTLVASNQLVFVIS